MGFDFREFGTLFAAPVITHLIFSSLGTFYVTKATAHPQPLSHIDMANLY